MQLTTPFYLYCNEALVILCDLLSTVNCRAWASNFVFTWLMRTTHNTVIQYCTQCSHTIQHTIQPYNATYNTQYSHGQDKVPEVVRRFILVHLYRSLISSGRKDASWEVHTQHQKPGWGWTLILSRSPTHVMGRPTLREGLFLLNQSS